MQSCEVECIFLIDKTKTGDVPNNHQRSFCALSFAHKLKAKRIASLRYFTYRL